jgi:hypothetical protein
MDDPLCRQRYTVPGSLRAFPGLLSKAVGWLIAAVCAPFFALLVLWGTLAIYYSNLPWGWARAALAFAFAAFSIWALWVSRRKHAPWVFAAVFAAVVVWWLAIPPSHERDWRAEVAVMARAFIDGDRVRMTGVRNFDYRSRNDFTVHYEEREFFLSDVAGIDFYVSYWREGLVGHTFLSFLFHNAPPLSVSIETRPEKGEGFDPIASIFKQFELIYVVGDERDIVGLRTNHRGETTYLYPLNASAESARQLLLIYLERINQLAERPEFYHLFSNSCTINIVRYANAAGRQGRFDIRHLFNGLIDSYLYHSGRVDTSLPFEELRRKSLINAAAQAAEDAPDFSRRIRMGLPVPARK